MNDEYPYTFPVGTKVEHKDPIFRARGVVTGAYGYQTETYKIRWEEYGEFEPADVWQALDLKLAKQ